ncbi:MAG: N-acetylmuramoyl-L-alanine amidase [Phycisphaeraceae bacterium]|nr:N-acetylmuramoyl-L-alanine amidase [Phycisphaeraceae bacterium]
MIRAAILALTVLLAGCQSKPSTGSELKRCGDEIVVAGRFFHTGVPVVLWTDPGGYDGYRVEKRFAPLDQSDWEHSAGSIKTPNRYDSRATDPDLAERTRGGNWDIEAVRETVDQIVLHYDASGTSRQCFRTLHDVRGLSIHFMVDLDGTIYQTLDVKERAWHATKSNARSIGIEIANIGAYPSESPVLERWYTRDERGLYVTLPPEVGDGGIRTPGFVARPRRPDFVRGEVHGQHLVQADYTAQQYSSLASLLSALHIALPEIPLESPRDTMNIALSRCLSDEEWLRFKGLLGHEHIQQNKVDPGPAMDWEFLLDLAKKNSTSPSTSNRTIRF